eukprot:TRINITY_DN2002_c0_g1_i1.p1 TRINITY_DN2002_c0_g1~~TRINITY_DN2002_c0_g1_i1.p1  ORF type:complete len:327 (-),score=68.80 TRINITY_DN2002_c0_g1_i1:84-944(-)
MIGVNVDSDTDSDDEVEMNNIEIAPSYNVSPRSRWARLRFLWLGIVNLGLFWALFDDSKKECSDTHLKYWIYVMLPVQLVMMISKEDVESYFPRLLQNPNNPLLKKLLEWAYRILYGFWAGWALKGIIWTFQARTCAQQTPNVYQICLFLSIAHIIVIGAGILFCLCFFPVMTLASICCPTAIGEERKITPRYIKKLTTSKKYSESIGIQKEDANCGICLCEYENGEEIRYLKCNHHFHSECIMEWLVKNMTCPFCKQNIENKEETAQRQPAQPDQEENLRAALLV